MESFATVYPPSEDTYLLIEALEADRKRLLAMEPGSICMELGCGSGEVTKTLARLVPSSSVLLAVDINPSACVETQEVLKEGSNRAFDVINADLAEATLLEVDVLVFNPPYVPTDEEEYRRSVEERDISASWAGGKNGREVVDRLFPQLPRLMRRGGIFYLVVLKANNPESIMQEIAAMGFTSEIVMTRRAGFEQLLILRFIRGS